ncbi:MAG: acetyl-CoA carboxylase biotin carboxyl carrier protein subunit [Chlorobium sp.]|jgi:glutaconyl-CoA/methylmalonyl-CoA decarboxylase subunit gamma|nr:MAG: acetyl-CoA carboxylase biotin carboxyl carrier protein subunit [Chlorobium sp.]
MRRFKFTIAGNRYNVEIRSFDDHVAELEVNGTSYLVELDKGIPRPQPPKILRTAPLPPKPPEPLIKPGLSLLKAPLPGTIIDITVEPGMQIKMDQPVIVLEAMKMENNIFAEKPGIVKTVRVSVGDTVMQGDVLIEIE